MASLNGTTESEWFRDRLVERDVPTDRIHLDNRATNTGENFVHADSGRHGFLAVIDANQRASGERRTLQQRATGEHRLPPSCAPLRRADDDLASASLRVKADQPQPVAHHARARHTLSANHDSKRS